MSMNSSLVRLLVEKRSWTVILLVIFVASAAGLTWIGWETHHEAPPIADFVTEDGTVVVSAEQVLAGQAVFQQRALMSWGSMFGDGALRGPDFTAEALNVVGEAMRAHHAEAHARARGAPPDAVEREVIAARVMGELRENGHDPATNRVVLTPARAAAYEAVVARYRAVFTEPSHPGAFVPTGYIADPQELRDLAAFFYWGAWVCSASRPGVPWSYTHNWPYDPSVGNVATPPTLLWSVFGLFAFVLGLGVTLWVYGQFQRLPGDPLTAPSTTPFDTTRRTPTQVATYRFFALSAVLFLLQVLAGILTIFDFVGVDLTGLLAVPVSRSLHTQLAMLWIGSAWMGVTIFVLPIATGGREPAGQRALVNALFGLLVVIGVGGGAGIVLGPTGFWGEWWSWLGHHGWEFMEAGRLWQGLLFLSFGLWAVILGRGLKEELRKPGRWRLPEWLVACVVGILLLFVSAFAFDERTNFVIADFWRWMVIHMWVEAFFEVFTTVVVAWVLVLMGRVNRTMAERTIFLAAVLFLGSGLLGISHNFYWNAKPTGTLALGAVFSTLQIVPLVLLTIDGWRLHRRDGAAETTFPGVWLFLLAVNFWNFLGAGVFGLIINLPIVNYYQHGSYLTVNHAHAALMGVYGNLSIAAMLFCAWHLLPRSRWNARLVTVSFWSINIGLSLMVVLDLFPVGVLQLVAILEHGYGWARSHAFVSGDLFVTLTWLRGIGANLFFWGGLLPIVWFLVSRFPHVLPAAEPSEADAEGADADAAVDEG